ncbi:Hypothetical protein R9X50_00127700 [Acrodontium crateriforme]|uniref:Zn(2)-C6 fungal-type domain-containing protein n=1 Tax=Acrodontium crateriforme TaxID=150365 RepID=A0AAQ3M4V5_9PEZI|nr:Hypothetical protein R9X50_00127700 [Acrodontium crateriforme]
MNAANNFTTNGGHDGSANFPFDSQDDVGSQWYGNENDNNMDEDVNGMDGDNDQDNDGAESRDAKRRRIARACDMCRKKKIKCDGKMPKCSHCANYKTECIFTQGEKKRAPPKGAKYIESLENRLGRMESLLRLSGLLADEDGRTDLGTLEKRLAERQSNVRSTAASPQSQPSSAKSGAPSTVIAQPASVQSAPSSNSRKEAAIPPPSSSGTTTPARTTDGSKSTPDRQGVKDVDALADQMCSLITNNQGETRYIGSSSGFSIFSPKGIQWVNEKTGDASFQQMIASASIDDKNGWDHWKPEVFNDLFSRRIFKPLPSRQECFALLRDYFEHFNQMFPLFHEPTFMHLVDRHYSLEPYEGSGWWASLNVALAIAHRLRVMSNVVGQEEDEHAWGYLKNAMAVMTELTMRNTDLLSVQALLGMSLFLQGTPNPQPSFFLTAAAIRLAHSIGLHKRGSGFNLNEAENEQRKRVFWIAYLLDKDICLRSGRPPALDDDDMNVDMPSDDPPDNVGNIPLAKPKADGKTTMNLFRLMCTFAQIQSRVYKQLYSVKSSRQSDGELLNTIGELDAELEEWKDGIPIDFRPEHDINAAHSPLILHVVVLHFAYYNCLTTIHRMAVHHGYWTSRLSDYAIKGLNARPLNPRVFMSAALCVNAARTSIGLIRYIPQGDYACVWLILYYPVSSLVTLFANILQNPQDARARGDLKLMSSVVNFLSILERDISESNSQVRRMLAVSAEFERIASVVLDKAEREHRGRGKRKAPGPPAPTERERERIMRDRAVAEVILERKLDEGQTLEQIQVETQAGYRRPVQTPSLRASMAGSQQDSVASGSPANFGASPTGVVGSEYRSPLVSNAPDLFSQQQTVKPAGQWNTQAPPPFSMQDNSLHFPSTQSPTLGGFSTVPLNNFHSSPAFSPNQPNNLLPETNGFAPNTTHSPDHNNPFQQPFVPQDLWQMPMTLEWDWAEGLGLGSFTPGPMMNFGGGGGILDNNTFMGGTENSSSTSHEQS